MEGLMWRTLKVILTVAVLVGVGLGAAPRQAGTLTAPASIHTEHEEIHAALVALTKVPGALGAAAQELAATLHPHFVREEEIALPPLAMLAPLAAGKAPDTMLEAAAMSDRLRTEMPRMLEEHKAIRAAVGKLRTVARTERHAGAEAFADQLTLHAQMEEEVLYPAAILVGDLVRARSPRR